MKKVVIGVVLIALLVLGCFEGEVTSTKEYPEPTSPVNELKLVEISFNQANVDLLKAMLSEDFIFYFDERDVGQSPPGSSQYVIPESWSYAEFRQAVKNMFDKAYSINLSINTSGVGEPEENEAEYQAEYVSISLLVMISELSGYLAGGGYCNFKFERYETEKGEKHWRLTGWWDRTSEFMDAYVYTAPTSLGRVLAMYR